MQRPSTNLLFNYWNELRGSRAAPERKNVEPTKIREALGNTFILEAQEDDGFAFRLAGSHLCAAYCRELKNRSFAQLWSAKDRDAIATLLRAVTQDSAVALVTFEGTTASNNKMSFETILMPLRHNGVSNSRILGGMTAVDEPYWFGAQPIMEQRITGLRLIWPDDLANDAAFTNDAVSLPVMSVSGQDGPLLGVPAKVHGLNARRYSHLAVIDGGLN